jgi:hypothetical protein
MKPRHFFILALVSSYLLLFCQVILAVPVLKGYDLGYYELRSQ